MIALPHGRGASRRSFWSFNKVQRTIGAIRRNSKLQLMSPRTRSLKHLDIGCGPNIHEGLINLDYAWRPGVDVCWNVAAGLPFASGSMQGVFSEHCLEHFPLPVALSIIRECRRVLQPGGTFRVIVPDAEIYIRGYVAKKAGEAISLPYEGNVDFHGIREPILDVNKVFYLGRDSDFGHWFIYDFDFMAKMLALAGFTDVRRASFRSGKDPALLVDSEIREVESVYLEANA